MRVRFLPFTKYHNKADAGSTRIRVEYLIKHWPEADIYRYGEDCDVLIFQKVYITQDYDFPIHYKGIKILDICDPDHFDGQLIKKTIDHMDAIVTPTKALQEFVQQMTDKPVIHIRDRFDLEEVPTSPKHHSGEIKKLVWFGYSHNAELLKTALPYVFRNKIELTLIANSDPQAWRWADNPNEGKKLYTFQQYQQESIYTDIQKHDAVLFPVGNRPQDRFKSENKTIMAHFAGLPVIRNTDDVVKYNQANTRNKEARQNYESAKAEYDCRLSVKEYKELINGLT